ncbi:hypothetical protein BDV25DRAFT_36220 [Aspergillus avenaceus]|uniref:Uncharacterized protein n=1 Tax=Aspergillus avenaceus TaxID=36643 RepID=A0A5N6TMB0_ASPAV|nr:hypothetical protein BDV25DRAFT_36220 [Aspergillus avenaceus]
MDMLVWLSLAPTGHPLQDRASRERSLVAPASTYVPLVIPHTPVTLNISRYGFGLKGSHESRNSCFRITLGRDHPGR